MNSTWQALFGMLSQVQVELDCLFLVQALLRVNPLRTSLSGLGVLRESRCLAVDGGGAYGIQSEVQGWMGYHTAGEAVCLVILGLPLPQTSQDSHHMDSAGRRGCCVPS